MADEPNWDVLKNKVTELKCNAMDTAGITPHSVITAAAAGETPKQQKILASWHINSQLPRDSKLNPKQLDKVYTHLVENVTDHPDYSYEEKEGKFLDNQQKRLKIEAMTQEIEAKKKALKGLKGAAKPAPPAQPAPPAKPASREQIISEAAEELGVKTPKVAPTEEKVPIAKPLPKQNDSGGQVDDALQKASKIPGVWGKVAGAASKGLKKVKDANADRKDERKKTIEKEGSARFSGKKDHHRLSLKIWLQRLVLLIAGAYGLFYIEQPTLATIWIVTLVTAITLSTWKKDFDTRWVYVTGGIIGSAIFLQLPGLAALIVGFFLLSLGIQRITKNEDAARDIFSIGSILSFFAVLSGDLNATVYLGITMLAWVAMSEFNLQDHKSKWVKAVAIIAFIVFFYMMYFFISNVVLFETDLTIGETVRYGLAAEDTPTGPLADVASFTEHIGSILTGDFDPNAQVWESRVVQDTYIVPEDAGVLISNIAPTRSKYFHPDRIEISGDVQVVSLFEEGTGASTTTQLILDVDVYECGGFGSSLIAQEDLNLEWCTEEWVCSIPGEDEIIDDDLTTSKFEIGKAYNRFFVCDHSTFEVKEAGQIFSNLPYIPQSQAQQQIEVVEIHPELFWTHSTQAISGRQIFVTSPDTLSRIEDPKSHYNIPDASFDPWSISDGTIDFGIGFDREVDFLRAVDISEPDKSWGYTTSSGFTTYFMGVSIKNDAQGEVVYIKNLEILIPQNLNILVFSTGEDPGPLAWNRNTEASGHFVYSGSRSNNGVPVDVYKLAGLPVDLEDADMAIKPGFSETYYMRLVVDDDFLQGSPYQSFFALASIDYDYKSSSRTTVRLESPFDFAE